MARPKSMMSFTVDQLMQLRDQITAALSDKAREMQRQLALLAGKGATKAKRGPKPGKPHALKGRKAPVKFRGPKGQTWAGRGQQPIWLREAVAGGAKIEDFAAAKRGRKPKSESATA